MVGEVGGEGMGKTRRCCLWRVGWDGLGGGEEVGGERSGCDCKRASWILSVLYIASQGGDVDGVRYLLGLWGVGRGGEGWDGAEVCCTLRVGVGILDVMKVLVEGRRWGC